MVDTGLRARVVRLLGGDVRADDLTRLFLYARDRCDGRESVQETGDFVAHHDIRTKGLVTRTTRDWYAIAKVQLENIHTKLDPHSLPPIFPEFLSAILRRLNHHNLRATAGLSLAEATKMLPGIKEKFRRNPDGTLAISNNHTTRELNLVRALTSYLVATAAFDGDRLFSDFCAVLKSHGLISKEEIRESKKIKSAVILFAASIMHNSKIEIAEGIETALSALANQYENISVMAYIDVIHRPTGKTIKMGSPIYDTGLRAIENCTPDLLECQDHPWPFDLEIGADCKLRAIA
jgi:hypothetical protein